MIFKFCFENEIHRCTQPPLTYAALEPFLLTMFKIGFPSHPIFHFLDENNNKVYIKSEDDYQKLLSMDLSSSIKIYITTKDIQSESSDTYSESEVIDNLDFHSEKSEKSPYEVLEIPQTDENPVEEKTVEPTEEIKEPEIESPEDVRDYDTESPDEIREPEIESPEEIKEDVREDDKEDDKDEYEYEEEPSIEEKIDKETLEKIARAEISTIEDIIMSTAESRVYDSVRETYEIIEDQDTRLREIVKETIKKEMPNIISELHHSFSRELVDESVQHPCEEKEIISEIVTVKKIPGKEPKKPCNFLEGLRRFGQFLKEQLMEIPEAAVDLLDDLSQLLDKDPNLFFAGGRYPSSVIQKAKKIKEIFPDCNLHYTLSFVRKLPRDMSVDQIVENYIAKEVYLEEGSKVKA